MYYYHIMPKILDGKVVRDEIMADLKKAVTGLKRVPKLAIVMVGNNPDSEIYVRRKLDFAQKIGALAYVVDLSPSLDGEITQKDLLAEIEKLNQDETVTGIIVQSPLPAPLNWFAAVSAVRPEKDVDGLCPDNTKNLLANNGQGFVPATARGVLTLLNYYQIPLKGKKVAVMGRSVLVGTPIAILLKNHGAIVTVVHRQTPEPEKITRTADILIVAIGQPELVGADYVCPGQVVVDVGITAVNRPVSHHLPSPTQDSSLEKEEIGGHQKVTVVGDVDFESVKDLVAAISPVPGGVGPMTVASLFQNLVEGKKSGTHLE